MPRHPAVWIVHTIIEVVAIGVGIATLPVSVPVALAVKAIEIPGRHIVDSVTNGSTPIVGPSIARTIDRAMGYAA